MSNNLLNQLTVVEALKGLKSKKFSSLELTKSCLQRIKKVNNKIKAFITICEKQALKQAQKADNEIEKNIMIFRKKPLLGIPYAVKDNFCTKGIKTTAASKVLENYIPPYNATVVEKLEKAGAILLGKTNLDAWAHGSSTETSDFFTTRNPYDLTKLPGGSSGGSAAAVASDCCIFALGSETAGSIRQPASWCGIIGFKPTYGRVSRYGLIAMASSTDCPGPLCKTIEDCSLILNIISGNDDLDATCAKLRPINFSSVRKSKFDLKGLTIGLPKQYFLKQMDKEVVEKVMLAVDFFKKNKTKIINVDLLDPKYAIAVYTIMQRAEVSSNLARYDGIRYGKSRSFFGYEAKNRIMLGTYALSAGYYDKYYSKAQKVRTLILKDFEKVFKKTDLLIAPATPTPALPVGASKKSAMFGELMDVLFEASSMAGLPGVSLPCGFSSDNLPIGMQLIGPRFSEELLFKVGYFYQKKTKCHQYKPKL